MTHTPDQPIPTSRLARCGCGTYHLTLGPVTLHLLDDELVLLARTILKMARRQPVLQAKLAAGICSDAAPEDAATTPGQTFHQ